MSSGSPVIEGWRPLNCRFLDNSSSHTEGPDFLRQGFLRAVKSVRASWLSAVGPLMNTNIPVLYLSYGPSLPICLCHDKPHMTYLNKILVLI